MFNRICVPKLLYLLLPVILLLLSACSPQSEVPPTPTQAPTEPPAPTATTAPTEPPAPTQTDVPTDAPEPTEALPTEVQPTKVIERPDITITLPEGDPERGDKLALGRRCKTCHEINMVAPGFGAWEGLPASLARAEMRIADPAYTGFATTPEEYLIESIIDPAVYIIPGEWEVAMDLSYDRELDEKDLADIIAWMLTQE